MDVACGAGASFGEVHFGSACLGDKRRTRRLVKTANLIMKHPGGTLPDKLGDWADLMGLYRLAAAPRVTHRAVIEPHCRRTLALASAAATAAHEGPAVVLLLHDSTDLDYTQLLSLKDDLGQIGNGEGRGYVCHNTLAVTPDRRVIGLAGQILHRRRDVPKGETAAQKRDHPGRESLLWPAGCAATGPGPGPDGRLWVDVCDRGADTFEFLDFEHRTVRKYVVRSAKDRVLAGEDHVGADRVHQTLHAYTRDLPTLGERTVKVPRRQQGKRNRKRQRKSPREARTARIRVAAGPASVAVPHFARGHCRSDSLDLWVVHVLEVDPPAGEEPLEWVLLTNVAVRSFADACERIDWYACRPVIEELHKGMKSGCGIECLQFEHADRLEPVIALLSVVATELLRLRQLARERDADLTPAATVVDPLWVKVLSAWRHGRKHKGTRAGTGPRPNADLSVREFAMALAKLGGHLGRKGDGFPGWQTTWRGWQKLRLMVEGAMAVNCV
jgi:hypothetical protein